MKIFDRKGNSITIPHAEIVKRSPEEEQRLVCDLVCEMLEIPAQKAA